jgi:succinoglycan biosynthesis protein ExoM
MGCFPLNFFIGWWRGESRILLQADQKLSIDIKMKNDQIFTITLCALTYHRPVGVSELLIGLGQLVFKGPTPDLRIVIVDNDPDGSSRDAVEHASKSIPWPVSYHVEPQRGITHARNRALAEVGESEWIGFIDDDEIPSPDWLDELLRIQCVHDADVVSGPVIPHLPEDVPRWIEKGGFFNPMRYATGTNMPYCFTNNVIFRAQIIRDLDLLFDHRFALTGGEDRNFFQRIGQAGYRIIWADEARVHETVPKSRATARWILKRSYRCGNTVCATDLANLPGKWMALRLLFLACVCLGKGCVLLVLTFLLGRTHTVRHLQGIYWGAGMLAQLLGSSYAEYETTHGH